MGAMSVPREVNTRGCRPGALRRREARAGVLFVLPWIIGLTIFSIFGGSYVGGYSEVFGIQLHHHLPFWWDIGLIAVFALIVFYYGVNSRLSPEKVQANAAEAQADANQEEEVMGASVH